MNKNTFREYIQPVVVLVAICLVASFVLAYVNQITAPIIDEKQNAEIYAAMHELLPDATGFTKLDCSVNGVSAFYQDDGGTGYAAVSSAKGFHSDITVTTVMDPNGVVLGLKVDASGETATIGAKVAESSYADKYVGVSGSADSVDVLSGATYSSRALRAAVNEALTAYSVVVKGAAYDPAADTSAADTESSATTGSTADSSSGATSSSGSTADSSSGATSSSGDTAGAADSTSSATGKE
ncbi:MAG: FMN-binding protein [Oscillospiraceae bacterium]|nr:FMN-binding protein [Oscillospiraceae bacterium]